MGKKVFGGWERFFSLTFARSRPPPPYRRPCPPSLSLSLSLSINHPSPLFAFHLFFTRSHKKTCACLPELISTTTKRGETQNSKTIKPT
jgi:hypothetical protein